MDVTSLESDRSVLDCFSVAVSDSLRCSVTMLDADDLYVVSVVADVVSVGGVGSASSCSFWSGL